MTFLALGLLALLSAQADPGLRERVAKLADDPATHREEIVALGPAAIRPLLDLKRPELDPVVFDLKFAGSGEAGAKVRDRLKSTSGTFAARELSPAEALRLAAGISGVSVFLDPDLGAARRVTLDVQDASMKAVLDLIAARSGLEYGWVRGLLVMSTAERLWPDPPGPLRPIEGPALAKLKEAVAALSADSIADRAEASRALEAAGEAALPHLEEEARTGDLDRRTRLRDAIRKIRARSGPAHFARGLALERQEPSAAVKAVIEALTGRTVDSIDLAEAPLSMAIPLVLSSCHVEGRVAPAVASRRVACVFDGQRALDVLYFLTAPYGLDAAVKDGKVVVDTRAAIEALLSER